VVSTQLKNMSQNGNLPQIGVKIEYILKPAPSLLIPSPLQKKKNSHDLIVLKKKGWLAWVE